MPNTNSGVLPNCDEERVRVDEIATDDLVAAVTAPIR